MMSDASGWFRQMPYRMGQSQTPRFASVFLPYERMSLNNHQKPAPQQIFTQDNNTTNRRIWTA